MCHFNPALLISSGFLLVSIINGIRIKTSIRHLLVFPSASFGPAAVLAEVVSRGLAPFHLILDPKVQQRLHTLLGSLIEPSALR